MNFQPYTIGHDPWANRPVQVIPRRLLKIALQQHAAGVEIIGLAEQKAIESITVHDWQSFMGELVDLWKRQTAAEQLAARHARRITHTVAWRPKGDNMMYPLSEAFMQLSHGPYRRSKKGC